MPALTIKEALSMGAQKLNESDSADVDPFRTACILLCHLTGMNSSELVASYYETLPETMTSEFISLIERRQSGEPLQYILGEWDFYGRKFVLNNDVFIPRPETEFIIEAVKKYFTIYENLTILDLGTGSGAVGITLAAEFPKSTVIGVDISLSALRTAAVNSEINEVQKRVRFINGDATTFFKQEPIFDLIVTNPPYVPEKDFIGLQREIVNWEPDIAFLGGSDGLDFLKRIFPIPGLDEEDCIPIETILKENGIFITEIGWSQKKDVMDLVKDDSNLEPIEVMEDYNGFPRTIVCRKSGEILLF
jgi:release factor glutamine methyltransferase